LKVAKEGRANKKLSIIRERKGKIEHPEGGDP